MKITCHVYNYSSVLSEYGLLRKSCTISHCFVLCIVVQQREDLVVEVYVRESRAFLPLCYDAFLQNWDADICQTLGKGYAFLLPIPRLSVCQTLLHLSASFRVFFMSFLFHYLWFRSFCLSPYVYLLFFVCWSIFAYSILSLYTIQ